MAPKKKRKKEADDDDELAQEALAEWLSRGLAAPDFTLDKMLRLWTQEGDDGGEDDDDGDDALVAKQELIQQSYNVLAPALAQAKELASDLRDAAAAEAKHLWSVAKHYAEIPPLQRRRLLRDHVRDVRAMDAESVKYALIRRRFAADFEDAKSASAELQFGLKKRNQSRAPLLARFRESKREADKEQLARIQVDIERERQERADRELQAKQVAREAKEQAVADQLASRRQMNVRFWRKQHAEAKAFSEQQVRAQQVARESAERAELQQREVERMGRAESDDALRDLQRDVTRSSVGIFDTALAPGEWHSAVDGGHRLGLDEHTIGVASARGYVAEHEVTRIELSEAQSKVLMLQEKLEQSAQVNAELVQDRGTIHERRDQVIEEIKYIGAEFDDLSQVLAGPPRRDPSEDDKMHFHVLVSRKAAQMQQLAVLDARLENLRKREQIVARSERAFAPLLAEAQASEARLQTAVEQFEAQHHDLPMVVGRSIFKPSAGDAADATTTDGDAEAAVTEPFTDPNALFAQVTMQSKLELLKHAAIPAREHYKTAKRLSTESWAWGEHKALAQQELEVTKTRLADVRDRFVEQQRAGLRADLMQAIHRYHQGGNRLRTSIFPLKGYVAWWEQRVPAKSFNVELSEALGGVHLAKPHTSGEFRGSFRFPKRGSYRLQLVVRLERLDDGDNTEPPATGDTVEEANTARRALRDFKFFIGSDFDALQEFTFRDPGGKVVRTGSLSFEYFGSRLCYCVALRLRNALAWREKLQFVVSSVGSYEERLEDFRDEEQRMRWHQQESHFVSELVKTIRLQSKQTSSERCTDLLKELMDVDKSRAKTWDSKLLHGHEQRFSRSEYARMLRLEIKKEVTRQIDHDVSTRKARGASVQDTVGAQRLDDRSSMDASRTNFMARKFALVEPQLLKAKEALGDYCSLKAAEPTTSPSPPAAAAGAYAKESMIVGLRFEWREAKSKLHVMHKAPPPSSSKDDRQQRTSRLPTADAADEWRLLDNANAVFLASAFAAALKTRREEERKARMLERKKDEQLRTLECETQKTVLEEKEAQQRERSEDRALLKLKADDLARRRIKLHWDAIRLTTYNESVSAQLDLQVQRRVTALAQADSGASNSSAVSADAVASQVKEAFAAQFVEGRLALAHKTWERKEKRIADKREAERRERAFRIRQESALAAEIAAANALELGELRTANERTAKLQLHIPSFELAVQGRFPCEHRDVKSWGSKYDAGARCKQCSKQMAKSFDEPLHARGADPELDRDVEAQRAHDGGGPALRFTSAAHLQRVEDERVRLEKEARLLQLTDAVLYDRAAPKAIDALNFRHGLDRGLALTVAGSDPLFQRVVHETHHAAFQDAVLFHGRLRNFHVRLQQLGDLHALVTTRLALERDFLENATVEDAFVAEKLPLVERDHARAERLLAEDAAALERLAQARAALAAAQRERATASHALEGVEEEAEFAAFHVPALVASSDEMRAVVERLQAQHRVVEAKLTAADEQLGRASDQRAKTDGQLSRLLLRTPGTLVRTAFGFATVLHFREADGYVVLAPLRWRGTFFFAAAQVTAFEDACREEERVAMASEEREQRRVYDAETRSETRELALMRLEDAAVRVIVQWRAKQEQEEAAVRRALEDKELEVQLQYELAGRKRGFEAAAKEAKRLSAFARVSLKRRATSVRPSRLDLVRVTRACEKRLAMASVEAALAGADVAMRAGFVRERDALLASELGADVFAELLAELTRELSSTAVSEAVDASRELRRSLSTAIVPFSERWETVCSHTLLGFDRVWAARKAKHAVLHATWRKEEAKLRVLAAEMARREEIRRLAEAERARLELRRKEMLAEERRCRQFYLDESVRLMQERKAMARAELEMRELVRQLELEAMKTKYAKMVEDRTHASDKAARRLEIKLGKNEKHRLHREWALIKDEDVLATQLRERELAAAQAEALERQFDRFLVQQAMDGKVAAALEASRLQERVREAQRLAAEQRAAFERQLAQERMVAAVTTFVALAAAEVAWMDAVERAAYWLRQLAPLATTLAQLRPELERTLAEREHVVADAKLKREHADACQARLRAATGELERAIAHEDECARAYKKLHFANATMDSAVLHGRPQRFSTAYLREQLHSRYFRLLTESLVRRAVVECSKREVARLEAQLRQLHAERVAKSGEVSRLKRKRRRAFHLSLRRAELGKLLFGGSQRRVLQDKFQQWARLWSQRVVVRASFELKHSLLLQQQRLRCEASAAPAKLLLQDATKLSVLHDHQRRRVQCRLCQREYSEAQNHRFACSYHPAAYELACVRSCASRAVEGGAMSASCMLHRARRWLCCDATDEGRFGSNGCARRHHMPTRASPALEQLVARKTQQEATLLEQLDQQLLELRERNVVGNMKAGAKAAVARIERDLAEKRAVAAKFHTLDRR